MKYRCLICGHIYDEEKEGVKFADLPADWKCPTCKQPKEKFVPVEDEMTWAAEHVVGVAKDVAEDIKNDLRANFEGECSEVGMYLATARVAHREGSRIVKVKFRFMFVKMKLVMINMKSSRKMILEIL